MANIKSAEKRVRTSERNRRRNVAQKSALKTAVKRFKDAIETGSENTSALYVNAIKNIDKAAAKGLIHKNAAARYKSRLTKKLASVNS
ncbi:MAG: 30S ribosomal protein S20 [Firmicutes bacterium]|nr:30S ribosomal protein S20 [Bacillota bacterium]